MLITQVVIQNFRCFGSDRTLVDLDELTALVGTNGCGKTAVLQALSRLFGISAGDRTIEADDFHLPKGKSRDELKHGEQLQLVIEAWIAFPELDDEDGDHEAIPHCFSQMKVDEEGADPFCRVRLEATWTKSNLPDGEVEQRVFWVKSSAEQPKDADKKPMPGHERSHIHVHYVPAVRDPLRQIRYVSGSIVNRLFDAAEWSEDVRTEVEDASKTVQEAFGKEPGVQATEGAIRDLWQSLHAAELYSGIKLRPIGQRLEEIFRQVQAVFSPSPKGEDQEIDRLSDGLKSLFYLAMVGAAFQIETDVIRGTKDVAEHFSAERLDPPALTLFAVEEPENHIAPHFLGRIVSVMRSLIATGRGQVLLTSHSPSIMKRVEPEEVRHLRMDLSTATSEINAIELPDDEDDAEAYKFVREAVLAYPELYFARLVVLGEGDSEEIVIPRLAAANGVEVDLSFVSVVPLGGRHVNHFWRLLDSLSIPYVTLLDLDRERKGGGWGRVHYALTQLIERGHKKKDVLAFEKDGKTQVLSDEHFAEMPDRDPADEGRMKRWLDRLAEYGVFFAAPLDLDFLMLQAFPDAYKTIPEGADGPDLPDGKDAKQDETDRSEVIRAVLKKKGGKATTYSKDDIEDFFWYRYLFLGRGKPTTHLAAMTRLSRKKLRKHCPPVLQQLNERMKASLAESAKEDAHGSES